MLMTTHNLAACPLNLTPPPKKKPTSKGKVPTIWDCYLLLTDIFLLLAVIQYATKLRNFGKTQQQHN